jgi:uncharacterized protein (DUF433 family)
VTFQRISVDPDRMGGLACIRDTQVTVAAVLARLAAGRSAEQVLAEHPHLDREDIVSALEFAVIAVRERRGSLIGLA